MTEFGSCEFPPPDVDKASRTGSRVHRCLDRFRWEGVPVQQYKSEAEHWRGVVRMVLAGESGERTAFHVRYFEVAPGGFTSLERHRHEHVVLVLRGVGEVQLGESVHALGPGDLVYVAPDELHQFRNPSGTEPLGFLCIVDAVRDRPRLADVPLPGC